MSPFLSGYKINTPDNYIHRFSSTTETGIQKHSKTHKAFLTTWAEMTQRKCAPSLSIKSDLELRLDFFQNMSLNLDVEHLKIRPEGF